MKWFLSVCVLAGAAAVLSSSCGPKQNFCPTKPEYSCLDYDAGSAGGAGGQDQGPCDGASQVICSDGTRKCSFAECAP
jgi:hypothetical protein